MADIISSFNRGVSTGKGLVDLYHNQEDRKQAKQEHDEDRERNKVVQQRQDVRWKQGLEDRTQQQQEHKADRDWQEKSRNQQQTQWDHSNTTFEHQQEEYNHKVQLQKRKDGWEQVYLPAIDKAIVSKDFSLMETPEFQQYVKENPQFDLNNILGSDTGKALGEASQLLREASEGNLPEDNDPRMINAVEKLFPEITNASSLPKFFTDKDGKRYGITGRRISGVHVMDNGTMTIQQELQLDNGEVVKMPVTQNRSSDPNDNVMMVPVEVFTNRMNDIVTTQQNLSATELNNWRQLQTGRSLKTDTNGNFTTSTKSASGRSGGGSSSSLTKQQLSEQADINQDYDDQISSLQSMGGDDIGPQVDKLNQQRAEALQRHTAMYMPLTGYDPQQLSRQQAEQTATRQTSAFVESYPDYQFDAVDKAHIQNYLVNNPSANPDDVNQAIQIMIKNGSVTKRQSGSNASDLVNQARTSQGGGNSGQAGDVYNNMSQKERVRMGEYARDGQQSGQSYRPEDVQNTDDGRTQRGLDTLQQWK